MLDNDRKEITEWASEHFKFYCGVLPPTKLMTCGIATFYFANEIDAMAFKLRWV